MIRQLTKRDVPTLPFPQGTELFQMLWCPDSEHHEDQFTVKPVFYWRNILCKNERLLSAVQAQYLENTEDTFVPYECAVFPERVTET